SWNRVARSTPFLRSTVSPTRQPSPWICCAEPVSRWLRVRRSDRAGKGTCACASPPAKRRWRARARCFGTISSRGTAGLTGGGVVVAELQRAASPKKIIERLSRAPAFQSRQFGIVDLTGRTAGHSGLANTYVSQDIQGRVPGTQIYYSIQGNILRPGEVVPNAVKAFLDTKGSLTDRVMAAMEAADASGGDSRCTCPATPATEG